MRLLPPTLAFDPATCEILPRPDLDALAVMAAAGDLEAERAALRAVFRMLHGYAKRICYVFHVQQHVEDVTQDAVVGAVRAARGYSSEKGAFTTYALTCAKTEVWDNVGSYIDRAGRRLGRARLQNDKERTWQRRCLSIDQALGHGRAGSFGDDYFAARDFLASARDGREAVLERESLDHVRRWLRALPARERDIVERRNGIGRDEETLEQIGASYNITRERVRQIAEMAYDAVRPIVEVEEDAA